MTTPVPTPPPKKPTPATGKRSYLRAAAKYGQPVPIADVSRYLSPGMVDALAADGCCTLVVAHGSVRGLYEIVDLEDGSAEVRVVRTWC